MDILEVLDEVVSLLQQRGRVTYRILKRQFALDDEALDDLKEQLIEAEEIAIDKDGKMLVWIGQSSPASRVQRLESETEHSPDARRETLDRLATPHSISLSASGPNKRRWNPAAVQMASAKLSLLCLLTSKAQPP